MARRYDNEQKYELREVRSLHDGISWYEDETFHIANIAVHGDDTHHNLLYFSRKYGYVCKRGVCRLECIDGSMYQLVTRKEGEILLDFVPII